MNELTPAEHDDGIIGVVLGSRKPAQFRSLNGMKDGWRKVTREEEKRSSIEVFLARRLT